MYHTWKRLFFLIVLCCPVAVAAEDGNLDPGMAEPRDATAFRDCVLKAKDWKTDCSRMPLFPTENPYSSDDSYFSVKELVPERGGVWGQTPAETFRKLYFPEKKI